MKKTEESQKMVLKDHYDALSEEDKIALRKEYMDATGMAYTTFYMKLRTDSFRPLERNLFEKLISDHKVPSVLWGHYQRQRVHRDVLPQPGGCPLVYG